MEKLYANLAIHKQLIERETMRTYRRRALRRINSELVKRRRLRGEVTRDWEAEAERTSELIVRSYEDIRNDEDELEYLLVILKNYRLRLDDKYLGNQGYILSKMKKSRISEQDLMELGDEIIDEFLGTGLK